MVYELYIDMFFLVNFIMDICILFMAKKILKCPATYGNICQGAGVGAVLTCLTMFLPVKYSIFRFVIFHGVINIIMTRTGLRIKGRRRSLRAYLSVYASSIILGGVFSGIRQYMREGSLFLVFAVFSYFAACKVWNLIAELSVHRHFFCEVILCHGSNQVKVKAMIDTGNRLKDTLTGKPVSIISKKTAGTLWQDIPKEGLRYIPYHTIGKKHGILPVFVLDGIRFCTEEGKYIERILVAVSEDLCSSEDYEMILSPGVR